jgi:hypothetical protein
VGLVVKNFVAEISSKGRYKNGLNIPRIQGVPNLALSCQICLIGNKFSLLGYILVVSSGST